MQLLGILKPCLVYTKCFAKPFNLLFHVFKCQAFFVVGSYFDIVIWQTSLKFCKPLALILVPNLKTFPADLRLEGRLMNRLETTDSQNPQLLLPCG